LTRLALAPGSQLYEAIDDVAGIAGTLPRIDLLVLSEETRKGGAAVNRSAAGALGGDRDDHDEVGRR
jgi:phosphopantetheine adenylyltransferase